MCFLKDMILQKQPHMRLLLQYTLFEKLLLIEFLNLGNHVLKYNYAVSSAEGISGNSSNRYRSSTCVSRTLAICSIVSRLGWVVLVIHLDTVAWSLPNLSANHLLFKSRSARFCILIAVKF